MFKTVSTIAYFALSHLRAYAHALTHKNTHAHIQHAHMHSYTRTYTFIHTHMRIGTPTHKQWYISTDTNYIHTPALTHVHSLICEHAQNMHGNRTHSCSHIYTYSQTHICTQNVKTWNPFIMPWIALDKPSENNSCHVAMLQLIHLS